jgi:hypothetical protein
MNNEAKNTTEEVKKVPKEKKGLFGAFKKKTPEVKKETPVQTEGSLEEGINLIPTLSKEEIRKEEKKAVLNIGSAFSLLALVLISVFVISFNIMSKMELNSNKEELYAYETQMKRMSQEIADNNEIVNRIYLFQNIKEGAFSPKEVVEYIEDIASTTGGISISSYEIQDNLSFEFTGDSQDLEKVSKFWYLLCNDSSISSVNLDSVSKGDSGAKFSFAGQFVYEDFVNND